MSPLYGTSNLTLISPAITLFPFCMRPKLRKFFTSSTIAAAIYLVLLADLYVPIGLEKTWLYYGSEQCAVKD